MFNPIKLYRKHRVKLITPLAILFSIVNLINFYFIVDVNVTSNDECLWRVHKPKDGPMELIFDSVKFDGVTWEAGIRDGDILLEINGFELLSDQYAQAILNNIPEGNYAKYKVSRMGEVFETKVYVKKLIEYNNLGMNLLAIFWILVGYVVVRAKPEGYSQRLFFRVGVMISLYALTGMLNGQEGSNPLFNHMWLFYILGTLYYLGAAFLPFTLIQFFTFFPKEFSFSNEKSVRYSFVILPVLIFFILFLGRIGQIFSPDVTLRWYHNFVTRATQFLVDFSFLVGLLALFVNYIKLKTKRERNSIFIILISFTIGVLSIVYFRYIVNQIVDTRFNNPEYYIPIVFIAVIPMAFGYSIFRYSLMDVSDVIKNTIIYGTATALIAGIYFLVIYILGQSISSVIESDYQGAIAAGIFIVFAILFQSTKDKFQRILTQRFYPEQFMYQEVIMKFSNEIGTIVGLENILDHMYDTLVGSLRINKFGILLARENRLELVRSKGFANNNLHLEIDEKRIIEFLEKNQKNKLPAVIEREEFEQIFENPLDLISEKIFTLIPLTVNSRVIGIIMYGLKYSGSRFTGKDLRLLETAAKQSKVAIENARLYESEAKKMKIERDLENAKTIQESLLPAVLPEIRGLDICGTMMPAMQIGGDYFDVIKVDDDKVFVIVGDVSGKGFSASFYMSQLHTMMHLFCVKDKSPKEILIEINKRIYESIGKNWFITISLALFDTKERSIKFCRAGHTPLAVSNNGSINYHQPKGIGVGLEKGNIFASTLEEKEIKYNQGDKFVFYSDGITEEMNELNELFGDLRFENLLIQNSSKSSKETMVEITKTLSNFRKSKDQNDDITLVLVKVN